MWLEWIQDCVESQGFSTSLATLCDSQMQHSLYTYLHGETAWIRNNSIAPFPPLRFHSPPKCRKMEWKGMEKEGKIIWKKLQSIKEMFDIDFGLWRWSTEPNVCVCDKTGVNLSSEAEGFFPQHWHYVLLLFSCYSITNIHFLPPRSYDLILSSGLLFGKPSFWNGREGLFVDLPLVKSQVGA